MLATPLAGGDRRPTLAAVCALALLAFTGCSGSDDVIAAEVGERLKEAGAPFAYGPGDTSDAGDPIKPPLMSTAYGTTGSRVGVSISVWETAEDAAHQKALGDEFAKVEPGFLTAACGTIFLDASIDPDNPKQRADFAKVEHALATAYGPC